MLAHILLLVLAAMSTLAAPTRRDSLQPLPKRLLRRSGSTIPRSEVRRAIVPLGPAPGVYEPGYDTTPSSDSAVTQPSLDFATDSSLPSQDSSSSSGSDPVDHSASGVNRLLAVLRITDTRVESNEWEDFAAVLEAALAHTTEVDAGAETEVEHADAQPEAEETRVYGQADESIPIATEGLAWRIAFSQARKKFAGLVVQDVLR